MNCININSPEFKELLGESKLPQLLLEMKIAKWQEENGIDKFPSIDDIVNSNEVNYNLKAVKLLTSDKGKQIFEKGKKAGWSLDKILTELQIPKEQKQLILDIHQNILNNARIGIVSDIREEIITDLLFNYSYTIEINTSKEQLNNEDRIDEVYQSKYPGKKVGDTITMSNNVDYLIVGEGLLEDNDDWDSNDKVIPSFKLELKNVKKQSTQYYSNLTVPGGTNYTENEIATPAITPSIKGHARFATDKGIGWFRGDEQAIGGENMEYELPESMGGREVKWLQGDYKTTKTRRILEVQSDLFQKGRNEDNLNSFEDNPYEYAGIQNGKHIVYSNYKIIGSFNTQIEAENFIQDNVKGSNSENKFLQLLNKDNNWVTFFIKSIIQDSAKKGYEKVLFPSGNTVVKIESAGTYTNIENAKEANEKDLVNTAIFYENTVTNILKKVYGKDNVKQITDEYGNTWNEIEVNNVNTEIDLNPTQESITVSLPTTKEQSDILLSSDRNTSEDVTPVDTNMSNKTPIEKTIDNMGFTNPNMDNTQIYHSIVDVLNKNEDPLISHFAAIIEDLIPYISEVPIVINYNLKAKGAMIKTKNGTPIKIEINPDKAKSEDDLIRTVIEEIIHGITAKSVANGESEVVQRLDKIRTLARDMVIQKYGLAKVMEVEEKAKQGLVLTTEELNNIYPIINLQEFIAKAINNKEFQKFLASIETTDNQNLWSKFINLISDILKVLGVKQDTQLAAVLNDVLNLFEEIRISEVEKLNPKKPTKSIETIADVFSITDGSNNVKKVKNVDEVKDYINNNINGVVAFNDNGNLVIVPKGYYEVIADFNVDEFNSEAYNELIGFDDGYGEEFDTDNITFSDYADIIKYKIKRIRKQINTEEGKGNLEKVAALKDLLYIEKDNFKKMEDIKGYMELGNTANEELERVETILNRPMNAEDIIYVMATLNYWKHAKANLFSDATYDTVNINEAYDKIQNKALRLDSKLDKIKMDTLNDFAEKVLNKKDIDLEKDLFGKSDIGTTTLLTRDISTYDMEIANVIWKSIQLANLKAKREVEKTLDGIDDLIKPALEDLTKINNKNPWESLQQKDKDGNFTGHLVEFVSNTFKRARSVYHKALYDTGNHSDLKNYVEFYKPITNKVELRNILPADGIISDEIKTNREALKKEIGEVHYNIWFKAQEKKINDYNKSKIAFRNYLMNEYNQTLEELNDNQEALKKNAVWLKLNSPYVIDDFINSKKKVSSVEKLVNFNNHRYYEPLIQRKAETEQFFDKDYDKIISSPRIITFLDKAVSIFKELEAYIPEHQKRDLAINGVPTIQKTMLDLFATGVDKIGIAPFYDRMIESVQTSFSDISIANTDPITLAPEQNMRISMIKSNSSNIQEEIEKKTIIYKGEHGTLPSIELTETWRAEIIDKISRRKSFDLGKVLKAYTVEVLAHKHKALIEDELKLMQNVMNTFKEVEKRPDGTYVQKKTSSDQIVAQTKDSSLSFLEAKKGIKHHIDSLMYGNSKKEEGMTDNKLTTADKEVKKVFLKERANLIRLNQEGTLSDDKLEDQLKIIDEKISKLGKRGVRSKWLDNVLKYIQFKTMGWNVPGAISNMGFGFINNWIEAAGEEVYTRKDIAIAYKMVMSSVLKNTTFNKVENDIAKKIRSLMDRNDILQDASNELYKSETLGNSTFKFLFPYNLQKRSEYVNQAPIMIAIMMNEKVMTDKGEISLWEGYDIDGKWKNEYGEEPERALSDAVIKIIGMNQKNHGNYDQLSPILAKKTILGRLMFQFRSWLPESVANRFEGMRSDTKLGIKVKGRYVSLVDVVKDANKQGYLGQLALTTAKATLNQLTFGMYNSDTSKFKDLNPSEKIESVDIANMRKVAVELAFIIQINLMLLMLKGLKDDDKEDKEEDFFLNFMINQNTRMRTDLLLYINPKEMKNFTKDIIPAMSLIKDAYKLTDATIKFVQGDDEIKTGVNAGNSRLFKESIKFVPIGNNAWSMYNNINQVFKQRE